MKRYLGDLKQKTYDLIVIGGGIMGTGIVRDAAFRGLDTLLVCRKRGPLFEMYLKEEQLIGLNSEKVQVIAAKLVSIASSRIEVRELFRMAHLTGLELDFISYG